MNAIASRRELLRSLTILGGAALVGRSVFACRDDAPDAGPATSGEDPLVTCQPPVIAMNHGHSLVVASADVEARATKTYSIQGGSGHDHTVTITALQFALLAQGRTVVVTSTTTFGHAHDVSVTCSSTPDAPDAAAHDAAAADAADANAAPDALAADADADTAPPVDAAMPVDVCPNGASATAISSNHGHALAVPRADVLAGIPKTYSIRGTAGHDHTVALGVAELAMLADGKSVVVESDGATHTHTVTVVCT